MLLLPFFSRHCCHYALIGSSELFVVIFGSVVHHTERTLELNTRPFYRLHTCNIFIFYSFIRLTPVQILSVWHRICVCPFNKNITMCIILYVKTKKKREYNFIYWLAHSFDVIISDPIGGILEIRKHAICCSFSLGSVCLGDLYIRKWMSICRVLFIATPINN